MEPRAIAARVDRWTVRDLDQTAALVEGSRRRPLAGGLLVSLGPDLFVNRAVGVGLGQPVSQHDLAEVEAFFAEAGCGTEIAVTPATHRSLLAEARARGYERRWVRVVLRHPLRSVPEPPALDWSVVGEGEVGLWAGLWAEIHGEGAGTRSGEAARRFALATAAAPGWQHLLACVDGVPAAVASLHGDEDVVELGGMGVLPAYRGRGLQRSLLAVRLRLAHEREARLVVSSVGPGTVSAANLESLGFRAAYVQQLIGPPA